MIFKSFNGISISLLSIFIRSIVSRSGFVMNSFILVLFLLYSVSSFLNKSFLSRILQNSSIYCQLRFFSQLTSSYIKSHLSAIFISLLIFSKYLDLEHKIKGLLKKIELLISSVFIEEEISVISSRPSI